MHARKESRRMVLFSKELEGKKRGLEIEIIGSNTLLKEKNRRACDLGADRESSRVKEANIVLANRRRSLGREHMPRSPFCPPLGKGLACMPCSGGRPQLIQQPLNVEMARGRDSRCF